MARKATPASPQPAQLNHEQMKRAIPRLLKRIEELELFDPYTLQDRSDPLPESLAQKVDDTLVEILGHDTLDYIRFEVGSLDRGSFMMGGTPLREIRAGFASGKNDAISKLRTLIELFEEKISEDSESSEERARRSFETLQLHPEIFRAVGGLYKDGHYANAIEDSCKALDLLVRLRSGRDNLSGTELMHNVFSPNNPTLCFNNLASESEKSEQQGMMFLYAGVMLAFRNPRAHGFLTDDPEETLEVVSFISFLAKALDRAKKQ